MRLMRLLTATKKKTKITLLFLVLSSCPIFAVGVLVNFIWWTNGSACERWSVKSSLVLLFNDRQCDSCENICKCRQLIRIISSSGHIPFVEMDPWFDVIFKDILNKCMLVTFISFFTEKIKAITAWLLLSKEETERERKRCFRSYWMQFQVIKVRMVSSQFTVDIVEIFIESGQFGVSIEPTSNLKRTVLYKIPHSL